MKKQSALSKYKKELGTGHGANYKPYYTANHYNSMGTASIIVDWKHGRSIHCMSQAEAKFYYVMRWDDNVVDIREQYPLNRTVTKMIADILEISHPYPNTGYCMTTDFLVTESDGRYHAYAVKYSKKSIDAKEYRWLAIEAAYWKKLGIRFDLVYGEDISDKFVNNIRAVVEYYDSKNVVDLVTDIKHKIATKKYRFDMLNDVIRKDRLLKMYYEGAFNNEEC